MEKEATALGATVSDLNRRLAHLYGAKADAYVSKLGENQSLTLLMSSLADRFAIDGESISDDSFSLLLDMLFDPSLDENGNFAETDIKREKKLLCEKLNAEFNEKRIYSLRKLEAMMFEGEPYAINRYGTGEMINALDSKALNDAYNSLLSHSKIQITVVGNVDIDRITREAKSRFANVKRDYKPPVKAVFKPFADGVKDKRECIDVEQGKLVIGLRVNREDNFVGAPDIRLFCDIFGGGPYSKLFNNVREKMSLCYYCSARFDRRKSCIIIQCGCEEENMDKAIAEIQNQLDSIKRGEISDEFKAAQMAISDLILSVRDDSLALCNWYMNQITDADILSPAESSQQNRDVTAEEVLKCSELLSLDSIFRLVPNKED